MAETSNTADGTKKKNIIINIPYKDFESRQIELNSCNEYEIILKIEEFHYSS